MTNREMLMEIIAHSKNTNAVMRAAKLQMCTDVQLEQSTDGVRRIVRMALSDPDDYPEIVLSELAAFDASVLETEDIRGKTIELRMSDTEIELARVLANARSGGEISAMIRDGAWNLFKNESSNRQQLFSDYVGELPAQDAQRRTKRIRIRCNDSEFAMIDILATKYADGIVSRLLRGMLAWME